ncbi:MAG: dihydrofolate reductase family protein [Terriglobales bacterium]
MPKLRIHGFSVSLENPLGVGGPALHEWAVKTRTFHAMVGKDGGTTGVDNDLIARGFDNVGAWIIGRNMFGPVRGPWPDDTWKGWWGEDPPYHTPVFVLTHHPRASLTMSGGTTFHFVTDGIQDALARALDAAEGKDVRLGGGAATIREYLRVGLVDEMHLVYAPVLLGSGECLLEGMNLTALGYQLNAHITTANSMHVMIAKTKL